MSDWTYDGWWNTVVSAYDTVEAAADAYLFSGETSVDDWLDGLAAKAWEAGAKGGDPPEEWDDHRAKAVEAIEGVMRTRPREWTLREEGCDFDNVVAADEAALQGRIRKMITRSVHRGDYGGKHSRTVWVDIRYRCKATGEDGTCEVQVNPEEPASYDGHEHEFDDDGPVRPDGGGVKWDERCKHCGMGRRVSTWDYRPDNGKQGYTTVAYEAGEDES